MNSGSLQLRQGLPKSLHCPRWVWICNSPASASPNAGISGVHWPSCLCFTFTYLLFFFFEKVVRIFYHQSKKKKHQKINYDNFRLQGFSVEGQFLMWTKCHLKQKTANIWDSIHDNKHAHSEAKHKGNFSFLSSVRYVLEKDKSFVLVKNSSTSTTPTPQNFRLWSGQSSKQDDTNFIGTWSLKLYYLYTKKN